MSNKANISEEKLSAAKKRERETHRERFPITDKSNDSDETIVVNLGRMRGTRVEGREVSTKSESEHLRGDKSIHYQRVSGKTPGYSLLSDEPFRWELAVRKIKGDNVVDEKVFHHTGFKMSPQMQAMYEDAKKGLTILDEKREKLEGMTAATSVLQTLIKIANDLDRKGLIKEADALDSIIHSYKKFFAQTKTN